MLTSRAFGHEGGNDLTAEFVNPGVASSPLSVTVTGNDIVVSLATDVNTALSSTAAQVVAAINANSAANALTVAQTFRGNAGTGIVQPRAKVNLSDFLTTGTNAHVPRGPFQYSVLRIGKRRDGSKVGVFLYCQQHAREWATPLTCLETAEQLLRNYAIDPQTQAARRQPRHLHPAVVEPGRRALFDAQLQLAAAQYDEPLCRGREGDGRSLRVRTSGRPG